LDSDTVVAAFDAGTGANFPGGFEIAGLNVGTAIGTTPTDNTISIGDGYFILNYSGGSPIIQFDTNDYIQYNRGTNTYTQYIASSTAMSLSANGGIIPIGLSVAHTGSPTASMVSVGDDNFGLVHGGNTQVLFDTDDSIEYNRSSDFWRFAIGGAEELRVSDSGMYINNGLSVGHTGTPINDTITIGDANYRLTSDGTNVWVIFDDANNDFIHYHRGSNYWRWAISNSQVARLNTTGLFIGDGSGASANERLTVDGAISLQEMIAPSATDGYGKIYVQVDGDLYYKDQDGYETNLLAGGGGDGGGTVTSEQGADGYVAFFTGPDAIAGDNDLFFNRATHDLTLGGGGDLSVSGRIIASSGSSSLPSITFANKTNTGIYLTNTFLMRFVVSGATRMNFNTSSTDLVNTPTFNLGGARIADSSNLIEIGSTASTSHGLGADDVIFGGDIEVDGYTWLDGGMAVAGNAGIREVLIVSGSVGVGLAPVSGTRITLPQENDAVTPTLAFGDGDTGFYEVSDDNIRVANAGAFTWNIQAGQISSQLGAAILNETPTSTNPTVIPERTDTDTGMGRASGNQLSLITGGTEAIRIDSSQKVGIGTGSPEAKLHVDGDGYFDGYLNPYVDNVYGLGSPNKRWGSISVGPGSLHITAKSTDPGYTENTDFVWTIDQADKKLKLLDAGATVAEFDAASGANFPAGGGGGSPGGSNKQLQFNDSDSFGGAVGITWDKGTSDFDLASTVNFRPQGTGGTSTVQIGDSADASSTFAVAIGWDATCATLATKSIAIGTQAKVWDNSDSSIAIGDLTECGTSSTGGADRCISIGYSTSTPDSQVGNIAIGDAATIGASSYSSIAMGDGASVGTSAYWGVAIGYASAIDSSSHSCTAVGPSSHIYPGSIRSVAVGYNARCGTGAGGFNTVSSSWL
jgi:hypothetical protein